MKNDYELLYLTKEGNQKAFATLVDKYYILALKIKKSFPYLKDNDIADLYVDVASLVHDGIKKYDDSFGAPFYSYMSIIIKRYFIKKANAYNKNFNLIKDLQDMLYEDKPLNLDYDFIIKASKYFEDDDISNDIINLYFKGQISVSEIAKKYNLSQKAVYNKIYGIKIKLKRLYIAKELDYKNLD